jgi:hypothetical protein
VILLNALFTLPLSPNIINLKKIYSIAIKIPNQTENANEVSENLLESSPLPAANVVESEAKAIVNEDSNNDDLSVNYTITSPLRKTFKSDAENNGENTQISATFKISSSRSNSIQIDEAEDKDNSTNCVTATINVPIMPAARNSIINNSSNSSCISDQSNDRFKKTDKVCPVPQPRSLFDIDNATSIKLADKLQMEAKKCDANSIADAQNNDNNFSHFTEALPPSPLHHSVFGERRPSWRLRNDSSSIKVIPSECFVGAKLSTDYMWDRKLLY